MPIPSNKNKGGLPDLSGNSHEKKKNILPSFDKLQSEPKEQESKPDTGLPDLTQAQDIPKDIEPAVPPVEDEDEKEFARIDQPKEQEPTVSYENNNSFETLSEREVQTEDAADEIEANTADQYTSPEQNQYDYSEQQPTSQHSNYMQGGDRVDLSSNASRTLNQPATEYLQSDDRFEVGTDTQYEEPDEYIDKKKKRIIPFGGNKSKIKKKSERGFAQFDDRKNLQTSVKVIRSLSMAAMVFLVGLGGYNTFFKHIPNQAEITTIAQSVSGNIGFPTQKGQAFAEQFAQAYLQAYGDSNSSNPNMTLLSYFYNGAGTSAKDGIGGGSSGPSSNNAGQNVTLKGNVKQNIIIQPRTFNSAVVSANSATFYVSALVSDSKGKVSDGNYGGYTGHWVSLAINVLYDSKHDSLSVNPDSPSIVPTPSVTAPKTLNDELIGNGKSITDTSVVNNMSNTINGFLTAYGNITSTSHAEINQFVNSDADTSVYNGFGGYYKYQPSSDSGNLTVYGTDNASTFKAVIVSNWKLTSGNSSISYPSKYVLTIEKVNSKYFVTKISPVTYVSNTKE